MSFYPEGGFRNHMGVAHSFCYILLTAVICPNHNKLHNKTLGITVTTYFSIVNARHQQLIPWAYLCESDDHDTCTRMELLIQVELHHSLFNLWLHKTQVAIISQKKGSDFTLCSWYMYHMQPLHPSKPAQQNHRILLWVLFSQAILHTEAWGPTSVLHMVATNKGLQLEWFAISYYFASHL